MVVNAVDPGLQMFVDWDKIQTDESCKEQLIQNQKEKTQSI